MVHRIVRAPVLGILALALLMAGCGGSDPEGEGGGGPSHVEITSPSRSDMTISHRSIEIKGTVTPPDTTLDVSVNGKDKRSVTAEGAEWSTTVRLSAGGNLITAETGGGSDKIASDAGVDVVAVTRRTTAAERSAARDRAQARARERVRARERRAERVAERRQTFITEAQEIDYDQLKKDPDSFTGEKIKVYGQIFQIQQEGDLGGTMLVSATNEGYDFWTDNVWVNYKGRVKGAEDDLITIYGVVKGEREYETQIGGQTYVPEVTAKYIEER